MKAIKVSYVGPTNTRGSYYKATIKAGSKIIESVSEPYNYSENNDTQAKRIALKLIDKLEWTCKISGIGQYGDHYFITIT